MTIYDLRSQTVHSIQPSVRNFRFRQLHHPILNPKKSTCCAVFPASQIPFLRVAPLFSKLPSPSINLYCKANTLQFRRLFAGRRSRFCSIFCNRRGFWGRPNYLVVVCAHTLRGRKARGSRLRASVTCCVILQPGAHRNRRCAGCVRSLKQNLILYLQFFILIDFNGQSVYARAHIPSSHRVMVPTPSILMGDSLLTSSYFISWLGMVSVLWAHIPACWSCLSRYRLHRRDRRGLIASDFASPSSPSHRDRVAMAMAAMGLWASLGVP